MGILLYAVSSGKRCDGRSLEGMPVMVDKYVGRPLLTDTHLKGPGPRQLAEPVRLTLALAGVDYVSLETARPTPPEEGKQHQDAALAQCPRFVDEFVDMGQGAATTRHLGRKHDLYGSGLQDQAYIDEVMDGVEMVRRKYLVMMHGQQLFALKGEAAQKVYWRDVVHPATAISTRTGRISDFQYLTLLLLHNKDGQAWAVGDKPSIADVMLFDTVDLHCGTFGKEEFGGLYPELVAHMQRFAVLPRIADYLSSPARVEW